MFGMAMIARSKAKAAAMEVMKDYKVSATSQQGDVSAFHWIFPLPLPHRCSPPHASTLAATLATLPSPP